MEKMRLFKKSCLIISILSIMVIFSFTACGKWVINSTADEVLANSWEYSGEYGIYSKISFENNIAMLTIDNNDEHCDIKGLCVINDTNLIIIDNSLKKEFLFNYKITGTTLTLGYNGDEIVFDKIAD